MGRCKINHEWTPSYTNGNNAGIGARVGFNFAELLDFFLGWTTLDICKDDIATIEKREEKGVVIPHRGTSLLDLSQGQVRRIFTRAAAALSVGFVAMRRLFFAPAEIEQVPDHTHARAPVEQNVAP